MSKRREAGAAGEEPGQVGNGEDEESDGTRLLGALKAGLGNLYHLVRGGLNTFTSKAAPQEQGLETCVR